MTLMHRELEAPTNGRMDKKGPEEAGWARPRRLQQGAVLLHTSGALLRGRAPLPTQGSPGALCATGRLPWAPWALWQETLDGMAGSPDAPRTPGHQQPPSFGTEGLLGH